MSFREWIYFQKSDRIVIVTFFIIFLVALTVFLVFDDGETYSTMSSNDSTVVESKWKATKSLHRYYRVDTRKVELFTFDPNTADSTQLLRLGLQPWQVRNVYRYRAAGGVYRKVSDFARLYGLTQGQYKALKPYIRIGKDYQPAADLYKNERQRTICDSVHATIVQKTSTYTVKLKEGQKLSINSADSSLLKQIPGIGSYYAKQIIHLRDRLGGFYTSSQLKEIEGFPEEALPYIDVDIRVIRKLKINSLSFSQLRKHPYINYYQAKAIDDYKRLHGPLKSLEQLRLLDCFPPEAIERLKPYVEF
jgi:DNA uptake protein ComE-like DNA-binding protein